MYISAVVGASMPTSSAGPGPGLMDVENAVHFLSTARPQGCPVAVSGDLGQTLKDLHHERPANDLVSHTFCSPVYSEYWRTFRPSKLSQLSGRCQSAIRQCTADADDVIGDGCVRPETDVAEAEPDSLPWQRMSTGFTDSKLCSHADQSQTVT